MSAETQNVGSKCEKGTCLTKASTDSMLRFLNEETARVTLRTDDLHHAMPLNHINLVLLSEELQRQTKETQKLQEEVEQTTRLTLERMGCKFSNTEMSANHVSATNRASDNSEYGIYSHQTCISPNNYDVDVNIAKSFSGKDVLEPVIEKCSQQVSGHQRQLKEMEGHLKKLEEQGQGIIDSFLKEQKERQMEQLINHNQQVEMLTRKLTNSQTLAKNLQLQVECLQKQVESQMSFHQSQMSDLESNFSKLRSDLLDKEETHKAKVHVLEEGLAQAVSQAEQVQRERDLSQQQAEELDLQLCRLMTKLHQTEEELSSKKQLLWEKDTNHSRIIQNLRQKLEQRSQEVQQFENLVKTLKEQCQTNLHMQMSGDTKQQEAWKEIAQLHQEVQGLKQAKDAAIHPHQEQSVVEVKQLQVLLEKHQQAQAEVEVLKLKLEESQKSSGFSRWPLGSLQQNNSSLRQQLEQVQLDNQQLRTALQEAKIRLSDAEQEKLQQQADLYKGNRSLQQLAMEKQQVTAELETQRTKLVQLKKEQEALREQHSRKAEELQEQNSRLKVQLHNIRNDLEQAKINLRALGNADGHGLKVALGMQKQITAKRDQVDYFQSRVQMLQEITEKLAQEKHYQVMKSKHQAQELIFEKKRRRRLETELAAHCTNKKCLKSKAERLESALHQMSDSFAECQEFIQKKEQEIMRLKLQHALELKEGQNLQAKKARTYERNQNNIQKAPISSPTLPAQPTVSPINYSNQTELNLSSQKCCPTVKLQRLMKELHNVINEEQRGTERPEQTQRRRRCKSDFSIEQDCLQTTDPNLQDVISAFSPNSEETGQRADRPRYKSSSCEAAPGQKSPVHSLLTSNLPNDMSHSLRIKDQPSTDETH